MMANLHFWVIYPFRTSNDGMAFLLSTSCLLQQLFVMTCWVADDPNSLNVSTKIVNTARKTVVFKAPHLWRLIVNQQYSKIWTISVLVYSTVKPKIFRCLQHISHYQFIRYRLENGNKIVKPCQNKFILIMSDNFDRKACNEFTAGKCRFRSTNYQEMLNVV